MTERKPHRIARFEDFAMTGDAKMYAFKIVTTDGITLDVELPAEEIGTFVQYIVSQAGALGQRAFEDGASDDEVAADVAPIPIQGLGMSATDGVDNVLLLVRLFSFALAFQIPSTKLEWFAENIRNTANLVAVDVTRKN